MNLKNWFKKPSEISQIIKKMLKHGSYLSDQEMNNRGEDTPYLKRTGSAQNTLPCKECGSKEVRFEGLYTSDHQPVKYCVTCANPGCSLVVEATDQDSCIKVWNDIQSTKNLNTCDRCITTGERNQLGLTYTVADTGVCDICNSVGECWDIELIGFYRDFQISDEVIYSELPRLRRAGHALEAIPISQIVADHKRTFGLKSTSNGVNAHDE